MMECLHCGDCGLRMSPLSAPKPCPKLKKVGDFYFCSVYAERPTECRDHRFPGRFCPVGMNIIKPRDALAVARRIDEGWDLIKKGVTDANNGPESV